MVIDPKRNQRFWQACGWTRPVETSSSPYRNWWLPPTGATQPYLPSPSDPVSFTGYLMQDGLAAVREKCELDSVGFDFLKDGRVFCMLHVKKGGIGAYGPTLSEAMFLALGQALGLDKEEK